MRFVVLFLAVLAGLKVWTQDRLYRSAAGEALIAAYQERAVGACQAKPKADARGQPLVVGALDWSKAKADDIMFGNPAIEIAVWQVDHALWNARYRNPILRLKFEDRLTRIVCDYDVLAGQAAVRVL